MEGRAEPAGGRSVDGVRTTRSAASVLHLDLAVLVFAALLIAASAALGAGPGMIAPAAALVAVVAAWRPAVIEWRSMIVVLLLIIMFIPIRRYAFAAHLPFQLEPYRVFVFLLAALWLACLLVDDRIRVRATGLEGPLALLGVAVLGSILTNFNSISHEDLSGEVVKALSFWIGFMIVLYMVASLSTFADADFYLRVLVVGCAILGALGVVEWKTGHNAFAHLDHYVPFLAPTGDSFDTFRAGLNRAYGSAQHPIAFGAALAVVLPVAAVYAFRRRSLVWYVCVVLIVIGSLASVSRTSMVMLGVSAVLLAALRPHAVRQALPFVLPLLVAIQIAIPGTFSTIRASFFPTGGLVEQQANQSVGSGRVASFGPAIDEASRHPLFGRGFGTRIVGDDPKRNSFILDDQWLSTTLELGIVGVVAWLWIFLRFCTSTARAAREDDSDRGWLLAALCASVASFAVGMIFYDAFAFIQVTLMMIVLLGLGAVLLREKAGAPTVSG